MFHTCGRRAAGLSLSPRNKAQLALGLIVIGVLTVSGARAQALGQLQSHGDVGTVLHRGQTLFDPGKGTYTVTGSGDNIWFTSDNMQFAWKQVTGDVSLTADIDFMGATGNAHRKAALMIRQSLDPNSAYADVARHGDGLTSLQYRSAAGDVTREIEAPVTAPHRVRIERRGDTVSVFVSEREGSLIFSGASMRFALSGPFYVGLAVSSHDKDVSETAVFSHLEIAPLPATPGPGQLWSTIETVNVASTDRRVAYTAREHMEAPNWTPKGGTLIFNQNGTLKRFVLDPRPYPSRDLEAFRAARPEQIDTGKQAKINNDHGLSPDGSQIAISDQTDGDSRIYLLPSAGGTPRRVTPEGPSYWHGWSPDGQTLAFTGQRAGEFDIYTVPAAGGKATRRTQTPGLDDGPDYSPDHAPDGQWIYFNSERTGHMQLWRMHPDGTGQEQVVDESDNDWFPHPSPDGKYIAYLAYKPGVKGHPANQFVQLRLFSLADRKVHLLADLFGGQGTINVPSWSPDSTHLAFVSYRLLP